MNNNNQDSANQFLAPKMVLPTAIRFHGLFGFPQQREHLMYDKLWTISSLIDQLKGMEDTLIKRKVYMNCVERARKEAYINDYQKLKAQIKGARYKLHMIIAGNNMKKIRNLFIKHKEMQRLYQHMPIQLVVENINQRTFTMRKEKDRLSYQLDYLKKMYKVILLQCAEIRDRIAFGDEGLIVEELKCAEFKKKIDNSLVRIQAVRTINAAYVKMMQCLHHESIFYDAILGSLTKDIEDQDNFIESIIYMGIPAIHNLRVISTKYRELETNFHKDAQENIRMISKIKDGGSRLSNAIKKPPMLKEDGTDGSFSEPVQDIIKKAAAQYVRETPSMLALKKELEKVEVIIKRIKKITLCSRADEIFPRIRSQSLENYKLQRSIQLENMGLDVLNRKTRTATKHEAELMHDLSPDEIERQQRIVELKELIKKVENEQEATIEDMKNRNRAFVLLRVTLWNLLSILRNVGASPVNMKLAHTPSYLELPLLKFEMLYMTAVPPLYFKEDVSELLSVLKQKLDAVMKIIPKNITQKMIDENAENYHYLFVGTQENAAIVKIIGEEKEQVDEIDILQEVKGNAGVLTRAQLKVQSNKIVEDNIKKDD